MDDHSAEFRRCLEECDTAGVLKIWAHVAPHLPAPRTVSDALIAIHHARTIANSIAFKLRAYSHCWLLDRGYPSGLPDSLKPKAERMYPRVVEGVGIAVKTLTNLPMVANGIRRGMENAVLEVYGDTAEGKSPDPEIVRRRMFEARAKQRKFYADLLAGAGQ